MITQIESAYSEFTEKHGQEPSLLLCTQDVYEHIKREMCCDWQGNLISYMAANIEIIEGLNRFEFE